MLLKYALGEVLREIRTEKKMSLRTLSAKSYVSLGYLSQVELGKREVSSEYLESIANALEVTVSQIIIESGYRMSGFKYEELLERESELAVTH